MTEGITFVTRKPRTFGGIVVRENRKCRASDSRSGLSRLRVLSGDETLAETFWKGAEQEWMIFVLFISTHLVTTRPEPICRSNFRISGKVCGHLEDTWM